ncbi:class B sortase [Paenibacillus qinlingensis]|uniref:Sortase B n=1 Tax=Paenibacillus qinlingensis TaxID=1837343 RepID=A0ABU1P6C9_9BACL|nr:class B sortase [Paenibacillus qinlingensis]MDR6555134.1 sortase B [Paenibacillus qinlingensis]
MFRLKTPKPKRSYAISYGLAGFLLVAGISFLFVDSYTQHRESQQSLTLHNQLSQLYYSNPTSPASIQPKAADTQTDALPTSPLMPENTPASIRDKIKSLTVVNKEIKGWLRVDGAGVDYPVVQHTDNDYYLHTDAAGKPSIYGSIFIDSRIDMNRPQRNIVIYGHNMIDGTMFGSLGNFKKESFYKEHHSIQLDLPDEVTNWEVFAVYTLDASQDTIEASYDNDQAFLQALHEYRQKSLYSTKINPTAKEQIITLVTCSNETDDTRLVVHAVKKKEP